MKQCLLIILISGAFASPAFALAQNQLELVSMGALADSQKVVTSCVPVVGLNFKLILSVDEAGAIDMFIDGNHVDRGHIADEPPSEFFGSSFRLFVNVSGSELNVHSPNPYLPVGLRLPMRCFSDQLTN